jgi:hypothetical protein
MVNVFGEEEQDPICSFRDCYHALSVHGQRSQNKHKNCVCKHFTNKALGLASKHKK